MLERLASLGFTNAEVLIEGQIVTTVRIRTSKGWTYERFPNDNLDAINVWSARHEPEAV